MKHQSKLLKFFPLNLLLSSTLIFSVSTVYAQDEDKKDNEEKVITVYGALSETPLSEMASSISVLDDEEIQRRQAQHLEDLFNATANVNFASGASRGRFVQIRGIGERSQFVDPISPSVGYLVDGIDYSGLFAGASTFDVQQIEIFKGPNSARFGAEGLAGMINVLSTPADGDSSGLFQAGIADYGSWHAGVAKGGSLTDAVDYRFSVHKNVSDGFIKNIHLNREDTQNIDELTSRASLSWQANDDLAISTTLHFIDVDNGYDAFSLDNNRNTLSDEPGFDRQESRAGIIKADYTGWGWANMQTSISRLSADLAYGYDEDWSYVGIRPGWEYSSTDHYFRERTDSSAEIKLSSKEVGDWVVGFYFADKDEDFLREYTYSGDFNSNMQREDQALFAQLRTELSDKSWLISSVRLARQSLDYSDTNLVDVSDTQSDWGAELSYHVLASEQTMVYASLMRSYKMGGVNGAALGKINDPALTPFRETLLNNKVFAPESLVGAEFGVKGSNADGNLTIDLAAFYQKREDVQYKSWIVEGQSFTGFYNNAVDGNNYGLEINLDYWANDNVKLFANVGWLKAHLNDFTRNVDNVIETVKKRDQAHAPRYQANLGLEWQMVPDFYWTIEVDNKDRFYYSYTHDQISDKQTLLHTNFTWQVDQWKLTLFARNLLDEDYANRGFYFGNDPRDEYTAKLYEQKGEPRRVGISVSYEF